MQILFEKWAGEPCVDVQPLSAHGSNRKYYRLKGETKHCLAAVNDDVRENEAFFYYSEYFKQKGVNVPAVYAIDDSRTLYLLEDLGNTTLYDLLQQKKKYTSNPYDGELLEFYKRVIENLLNIQMFGVEANFDMAYPRSCFDSTSIKWDLNYFKYHFLKLAYIPFDEQLLENDIEKLTAYIDSLDRDSFMYRDFQSRNIMVMDNQLYFIDYQGGRRGTKHYDLASLLYDAKAEMPNDVRQQLLDYYVSILEKYQKVNKTLFEQEFYVFVLLRIMQAMGAYGYRGFYEGKEHFVRSIEPALKNMKWILENKTLPIQLPHLNGVWKQILESDFLQHKIDECENQNVLTVAINSFSFKRGYPMDLAGNGGGFVFDCRALPNPGRYPQYKHVTGKDQEVIDFFKDDNEVEAFLELVFEIASSSVERYLQRRFTNLQVNFGCTGGQHRSVYCAERLAQYILQNYECKVLLHHLEQEK